MISRRGMLGCTAGGALALPAIAKTHANTPPAAPEPSTAVYPGHHAQQDSHSRHVLALMRMALARSGRGYHPRQAPTTMVQSRAMLELGRPDPTIDVFWTMTNPGRERHLLPVRIPLERGLIGWRLLLVRRSDLPRWQDMRRLADLAARKAGQMHDWPDTTILRANGLPVETSSHYEGLFRMLAAGRIDYFPRSVIEIGAEREAHRHLQLEIAPELLLYYPTALYFFVSPARPRLAADLTAGLEAMLADGSFERMFQQQFGALIQRYGLAQRHMLRLSNPELPAGTPLQRKELWLQPALSAGATTPRPG